MNKKAAQKHSINHLKKAIDISGGDIRNFCKKSGIGSRTTIYRWLNLKDCISIASAQKIEKLTNKTIVKEDLVVSLILEKYAK